MLTQTFLAACPDAQALRTGLPYPTDANRVAWDGISPSLRAEIIAAAQAARGIPYPLLTAGQFMAFVHTGDRRAYEVPYFARRHHLIQIALGACVTQEKAYVADVADGLWLLAEETSWVVSAHNIDSHPGGPAPQERPLPDKENPVIDLFAAQSGATVTLCCHLLGEGLDALTPMLRRRMRAEIRQRILQPFYTRDDFWWMGMIRKDVNNWTPWILSNVLLCLLYWETDADCLWQGLRRAVQMLERYVDSLPEDGGCDEGAGYWNMAGASLLDCFETLRHATDGRFDPYTDEKIRNIGRFPMHAHIDGAYFWNFADCDAKPMLDGERVYTFGQRIGDDALMRLGAALLREASLLPKDTPQMARVLDRLFTPVGEIPKWEAQSEETHVLANLQVWAQRKGRYYAAIKGGNNGENHNHNDVGSFLLYVDNAPAVIDAGNMTYSAKTFSAQRYTLWNTRAENHNIPLIAGREQCAGAQYCANILQMDEAGVCMDLHHAYPKECAVASYTRTAALSTEGLSLCDDIALEDAGEVTWVFLLREAPMLEEGQCLSGALRLTFPRHLRARVEEIPVTDERMARNFPGTIWRLTLTEKEAKQHTAMFVMEGYL